MKESDCIKVVKFGGSSLADAAQFKKAAEIILSDPARRYVVPSAPGKRFSGDAKVTDMLIECQKSASCGKDFADILKKIKDRFDEIIKDLALDLTLDREFEIIYKNLEKGCTVDYAASRGEYLNAILLAEYLGFEFIDAAEIIFFGPDKTFNSDRTNLFMAERLLSARYAVIPGFYGSLPCGEIKTFSRGGSDITGAVVARAVMADLYENWKDVSGFLMCDPKIVENPHPIGTITYRELRELSYMGATVLHEDSVFPVKIAGIPINIRNTNAPEDPGTFIVSETTAVNPEVITGIAGKKGFSVVHLEKDMMNQEVGFGMKVLQAFYDMNICFEHLPSGIDTMSVIVDSSLIKGKETFLLNKLSRMVNPDNISIEPSMALIAVVGRGMVNYPGTASRVFSAIAKAGINIKMIDQGSSELNIVIGVAESDFEEAIRAVYKVFCKS
ncbi:MAG: aspartate kinase [Eubacteriales bacterium]|nr:aspartate kinase [Eubacteriales bacterium]